MPRTRKLYFGDNLPVMREYIDSESVDLVYLDPPFNSNRQYNIIFHEESQPAAAQARAFIDTWRWNDESAEWFDDAVSNGGRLAETLIGLRGFLHQTSVMAYLAMLAPRLLEIKRVLKPSGSVVLHCDPTASHYIKLLMDAVFGPNRFQNEIVWCYRGGGVPTKAFARKHDILFFYAKSNDHYFKAQYRPYSEASTELVEGRGGTSIDGRARDLERGAHMEDYWTDINSLQTWSPERLGYPTQKPTALLERIIDTLCPDDGLVLDPFCGCGTTIVAAERLNREWIGIDIAHIAISVIERVLDEEFRLKVPVVGQPESMAGARDLFSRNPFQFEAWAISSIVGLLPNERQVGDRGVDGVGFFAAGDNDTHRIIGQVKGGGSVGPAAVRDLQGTMESEGAQMGVLVVMDRVTEKMREAAAAAGIYRSEGGLFEFSAPKVQIVTVEDYFAGRGPQLPPTLRVRRRGPR